MIFPDRLRSAIESNALRFGHKSLVEASGRISSRYREEKGDGSRLVTTDEETAAYAAVRMPATFAAVSSALAHALTHVSCEITTAADIGAGTGAAGWAAAELIDELDELHCFEREPAMRRLGEQLMTDAEISVRPHWYSFDAASGVLPQSYDLVIMSYTLNELSGAARDRVLLELWQHTDKLLLIVEPGTMTGYANIMQARSLLMSEGAAIAYPCPDISQCPLPEGDWCHFTARAARTKLHKQLKGGDVPYEDEKFSCVAAAKCAAAPCENRILRHPQTASGVITLHTCSSAGISDVRVTRSSKQFKAARKSDCGDCI